jgi:hypothetical protein
MENFQNKYMEIKNINKDIVYWLEDIAEENGCRIERKEWKSKYNSYVVYDYEPFCSEGFEINILLSSNDISYLNFVKYLYNEKLSTIEYLDNCAKITVLGNYIA